MAGKKAAKSSKSLGKKAMKKTKGGIIAVTNALPAVQQDIHFRGDLVGQKVSPGLIKSGDGSV